MEKGGTLLAHERDMGAYTLYIRADIYIYIVIYEETDSEYACVT